MNKNQDENRCLAFYNFAEEQRKIWFWDVRFNALFQGTIDGGVAEPLWGNMNDETGMDSLYSKVMKCGHKIIGIPMCTDHILSYDLSTKVANLISVAIQDWGNKHTLKRGRFWDGVVYGDYLFMIGFWSAKVLKFDIVNEKIVDVIDLYEELKIPFEERTLSFKNALAIDGKIWIPSYVKNYIFALDPNNMKYTKIEMKKKGNGFSDIAYDGEDIWLSPRERGQFVKWNVQKNEISLYDNYPAEFHMEDQANVSVIKCCNGKVYVFPNKADKVFSIKKNADNAEMCVENAFNHYYESLGTSNEALKYLFVQKIGEKLYSFCRESKRVLSYDTEKGTLSVLKYTISEEESLRMSLQRGNAVPEECGSLSLFIKCILG